MPPRQQPKAPAIPVRPLGRVVPLSFPLTSDVMKLFPDTLLPINNKALSPNYVELLHTLACYDAIGTVDVVLNGPRSVTPTYFDSRNNAGLNAGVLGFADLASPFPRPIINNNLTLNLQAPSEIFIANTAARIKPDVLMAFVSTLPVGSTCYCDVYNPLATSKVEGSGGVRVEPFFDGCRKLTVKHVNGRQTIDYDYSEFLAGPWFVYNNHTVVWNTMVVGPKLVLSFTLTSGLPPSKPLVTNYKYVEQIRTGSFADAYSRSPFDRVSDVETLVQLNYRINFPDFIYLNTALEYATGNFTSVAVPVELLEYLKFRVIGHPRNKATFDLLLGLAEKQSVSAGFRFIQPSKVIMAASYLAFVDGIDAEKMIWSRINLMSGVFDDYNAARDCAFSPIPNLKWPYLAIGGGVALATPILFHQLNKQFVRKLEPQANSPLVFALAIGFIGIKYIYDNFSFVKSNFSSPPVFLRTVCVTEFEKRIVEQDPSTILTFNDSKVDFLPNDCTSKVAAVQAGHVARLRTPIYSCQCENSLIVAMQNRLGFLNNEVDDVIFQQYKDALLRSFEFSSVAYLGDDNGRCLWALKFNLTPFAVWLKNFPQTKQLLYRKAREDLDLGIKNVSPRMESFVKFEPYMKSDGDNINRFNPRLIVKFDDTFLVSLGPFYHALGNFIKNEVFPPCHDTLSLTSPRKYVYASGMTADQLGDWYKYWKDYMSNSACFELYDINLRDFRLISLEGDCSSFDGHKLKEIKEINDDVNMTMYCKDDLSIKFLMGTTRNTLISNRLRNGGRLVFKTNGRHQSGHASTSVDNSETNIALTERAFHNFVKFHGKPIFGVTIVLGDDNASLLLVHNSVDLHTFKKFIVAQYVAINQELELVVHTSPDCVSFCSGYFYRVSYGIEERYLWAPKIGRVLSRLCWCKDPLVNPIDFIYTVLLGYRYLFPAVPILAEFFESLMTICTERHAKEIVISKDWEHKITTHVKGYSFSDSIHQQFFDIYGLSSYDIYMLSTYYKQLDKFTTVDLPQLTMILDRDLPIKCDSKPLKDNARLNQPNYWFVRAKSFMNEMWKMRYGVNWAKFERRSFLFGLFSDEALGIQRQMTTRLASIDLPSVFSVNNLLPDIVHYLTNLNFDWTYLNSISLFNLSSCFAAPLYMGVWSIMPVLYSLCNCTSVYSSYPFLLCPILEEFVKTQPLVGRWFWLFEAIVHTFSHLNSIKGDDAMQTTVNKIIIGSMCFIASSVSRYFIHSILTRTTFFSFRTRVILHSYYNMYVDSCKFST